MGCADTLKLFFSAPEFHAAFEVRIEGPYCLALPNDPGWRMLLAEVNMLQVERIRARRVGRANVIRTI
jgi:hypothetical protein